MSSEAPIFTRGFVLICLATFLSGSAQSLVLPAIPLLLTQMGLAPEFVGLFVGAFSLGALIVRFPVGAGVDRLGWRAFGMGGAGLLGGGCLLYALVPFVPAQVPLTATVPLLLPLAGIAHSVGFSSYGTSASSFVAHTVPATRRGEAVGYYGIVSSVAWGLGAGVSLLIVGTWGFSVLLGTAALMAVLAAIVSFCLHDTPRTGDSAFSTASAFRIETKVLVPALVSAALAAGAGTALAFIPLLGVERGIANPGIYFTAVALTSIAFRIIAGRLADIYGRFASIIPGMLLATAGLLLVARASSTQTLVLAGIVYGTGSASAAPALLALIIDLAGPARRGAAMAIHWAMLDVGVSGGSIITGQIAPLVGYGGAFVAASSAPLVGLGGFLAYAGLRRMRAGGDSNTRYHADM
ncbi:MAG: MFS transporter [Anaerolineae bacterium]|nr:MFS transporter [Anaerolineae bacterium]